MTRAVPPDPSTRAVLVDSSQSLGPSTSARGGDDDDADGGTDTAMPDDDSEDIASLTCQQSTSPQLSNF